MQVLPRIARAGFAETIDHQLVAFHLVAPRRQTTLGERTIIKAESLITLSAVEMIVVVFVSRFVTCCTADDDGNQQPLLHKYADKSINGGNTQCRQLLHCQRMGFDRGQWSIRCGEASGNYISLFGFAFQLSFTPGIRPPTVGGFAGTDNALSLIPSRSQFEITKTASILQSLMSFHSVVKRVRLHSKVDDSDNRTNCKHSTTLRAAISPAAEFV